MADGLGTELNLALGHETNLVALQRLDPDIVRIVDHASHTASYQFLAKENKWSPRGCEGPLFLAERCVPARPFDPLSLSEVLFFLLPFSSRDRCRRGARARWTVGGAGSGLDVVVVPARLAARRRRSSASSSSTK